MNYQSMHENSKLQFVIDRGYRDFIFESFRKDLFDPNSLNDKKNGSFISSFMLTVDIKT